MEHHAEQQRERANGVESVQAIVVDMTYSSRRSPPLRERTINSDGQTERAGEQLEGQEREMSAVQTAVGPSAIAAYTDSPSRNGMEEVHRDVADGDRRGVPAGRIRSEADAEQGEESKRR